MKDSSNVIGYGPAKRTVGGLITAGDIKSPTIS